MIGSYPSIYNLGHAAIAELLHQDVIVEEKIDGSQISFGLDRNTGELMVRSKGAMIHPDAPEGMFENGVKAIKEIAPLLHRGWVYRGEYLRSPKHNTLAYERHPVKHVILFDINPDLESYLSPSDKEDEAERIGLECVPQLFYGRLDDIARFRAFLETDSVLGGQKIEGVVVKPADYALFGKDKKCLMGKFVSEAFKEAHSKAWSKSNPSGTDIIGLIGAQYNIQGRWMKAVQHLREAGRIENSPRDIGTILKEIPVDIQKECEAEIKDELWKWAWPKIRRAVIAGVPEWYKDQLLKLQFEGAPK
jgi:hypothetical protein